MTKAGPQETDQAEIGDVPPNPRGLKAAVTIMGILLVVGFFVVFVTIIYRVVSPGDGEKASTPRGLYGEVDVTMPKDAQIVSTDLQGDRALIRIREVDGAETLMVFDVRRGHELGRFRLKPE